VYLRTQLALHIGVIEYIGQTSNMDGGELSVKMGGSPQVFTYGFKNDEQKLQYFFNVPRVTQESSKHCLDTHGAN
jgi:hypothetical protein